MAEPQITFEDWLTMGVGFGYCSEPVCDTHNGLPMTEEEQTEFGEGYDPCIPAVRLLGGGGGLMTVQKRKLIAPHMLSPTQFLVHQDIINEKIDEILGGGTPTVHGHQFENGRMVVEDGHHAAKAYEELGRKVPVSYRIGTAAGEPFYEWEDVHTVSEGNLEVDHPVVGYQEWEER